MVSDSACELQDHAHIDCQQQEKDEDRFGHNASEHVQQDVLLLIKVGDSHAAAAFFRIA